MNSKFPKPKNFLKQTALSLARLRNSRRAGFTLIEILLVVAAIGILAAIVIFAVNPSLQLAKTRDAQRKADVNTILNAVYQYTIDNGGDLPATLPTTATHICKTGASNCTGLINLSVLTNNETYLPSIPIDPTENTASNSTGYQIFQSVNNRITVRAPDTETGSTVISVTR